MKITVGAAIATVLLLIGFAAGFPVGKSVGFETGSEWAIVQADLLAREAGVFMPVYLADGKFRVVVKQPRNLHKRVWHLADRQYDMTGGILNTMELRGLSEQSVLGGGQHIGLIRMADQGIR